MSLHLISIGVLAAIFLLGTLRKVNLGALALVATFMVGTVVFGQSTSAVLKGFPANLFVILVGVTYLFAIAKSNGTVDWLVQWSVRAVRGHIAAIPWVMFVLSGVLVGLGALSPAAVAIIAPIGMAFATRYRINPLMMGLMVVHGSAAGNFSPLGVLGVITNDIVERSGIPASPTLLFLSNAAFNLMLAAGVYLVLGGMTLIREGRRAGDNDTADEADSSGLGGGSGVGVATQTLPAVRTLTLNRDRTITVLGMVSLVVGAVIFNLDIGLMAMSVAVLLSVLSPESAKNVLSQVSWGVVLLICGIVTYVGLLQAVGTVDFLSDSIAGISAPLFAALIICFIGAIVSAFASTTGILGALIPLAIPMLLSGNVGAIGVIAALAISASVVDSSPFSTNGALVVANAPVEKQDAIYRQLMIWGFGLVIIAPLLSWALLVWTGWW
ncbi:SLC13 family permease [Arthrobacter sp. Y81]|uniref:SLC13 family permease n=1 Tax=Arthrobacter sp. Y81 TaxID=2058897 RepID=UPI000CE4FB10|nr:SLC13 family permease [Arthrobacter sp. Y81]